MAKYACLLGPAGSGGGAGADLLSLPLPDQVARCVATKAAVVAGDEREGAGRMVLNYGHTLAHALEAAAFDGSRGWDLRHGEAVAVGLVFAAELARRLGRIDDTRVAHHRQVVTAFDLSGDLPGPVSAAELVDFMARDKKAHHDLTFVLDGPRGIEAVPGVARDDVLATLIDMGAADER
jgi:5-deoxy-5-amino-3-dehydroquinate synthase